MHKVYLDNAATTPLTDVVKNTLVDSIEDLFGNPSSIHHYGRISRSKLEASRRTIANILNTSVGEIFFSSSATESTNHIINKCVLDLNINRIIVSPAAHPCIINPAIELKKYHPKLKVEFVKVDNRGRVDLNSLNEILNESNEETLVSLMLANNELGTINDFKSISELCDRDNCLLHCDAVQYLGKRPINLQDLKVSFLTGTGHKFHAPKGIGFLYMNNDNLISPFIHGGSQERNIRGGTENLYGILAMASALEDAINHMDTRRNKHRELKYYMVKEVEKHFSNVSINGGNTPEDSMDHILNLSFPPSERSQMLLFNLDIAGICASSGSACSAGIPKDSHVLEAIKHPSERVAIRFSFSHLNTIEEIDYTIKVLKENLD